MEHYFSAQNIEKFRKKFDSASEFIKISSVPNTYKEKVKFLEAELEREREKRIQLEKKMEDVLLIDMLKKEWRDEVIDNIRSNVPSVEISDVFFDVTLGENNVFVDVKGYVDKQGNFVEYVNRIVKPKIL